MRSLIFSLILGTVAVFPGCSTKDDTETSPTVTVQVATVQRATIEREVSTDAILYPVSQAAIVPKISAPVSRFLVNRGSHVHAGQLLAELESSDLEAAVTESRGAYDSAEANYQTAVKSGLPEGMRKAELDVTAAQQVLNAQQKVYDNRQLLYQQGAIPRKDVEDATVNLTQARNQYEMAQKHYEALKSFANQDALRAAKGDLSAAKGKYDAAQAQWSYSQIKSPIDGVVTDRPLYPGEMVTAGLPLITVMDLARVVARAHISQQQAAEVKVGDEASISVPGSQGEVPAKVTLVSPALDTNSTTVEVWVEAANPKGRLQPGSNVRVTVVAETVKGALVVPATSLVTASDGGTSVIVAGADGKPQQKAVKIGIRQDDDIQIIEGISEGDRVVTQGAYELAQEDPDVLAKTKLQIAAKSAESPDSGAAKDDKDKDSDK